MNRKLLVGVFLSIVWVASGAMAQETASVPSHEIGAQGTGFFTKDSSENGISQHATDTGGFVLSYRYHFNNWLAADASYGYIRNTQQNFTSTGALNVQANVQQATGALVVTIPAQHSQVQALRSCRCRCLGF